MALVVAILTFQVSWGEVAIIQDPDAWTYVREAPDLKSEVIYTLHENKVFWYDQYDLDQKKEWIPISILKNDYSLGCLQERFVMGFIHRSRILPLENIEEYSGNDFSFEYELGNFDTTNKVIENYNQSGIEAINGRTLWGTDGIFPNTQVNGIKVIMDGRRINIHEIFYADLFECDNDFSIHKNDDTYFVHQWNSDGAGAYEIVWVLDKNGLKQRIVGLMI